MKTHSPFFGRLILTAHLLTPLVPLSAAEPLIRLAENGTARHAIVIDSTETATAAERFAAEELALFLQKITGAAFPIVKEGEQAGPGIYAVSYTHLTLPTKRIV